MVPLHVSSRSLSQRDRPYHQTILRILGAWYTPIPPHVAGTPLTQPTLATRTLLYPIFSGRATLVAHVHGTLQAFFDGAGRLQNIARHVLFPKIPLWGLADNTDAGAPADAAKVTISAPLHAIVCSATRARDQFGITCSRTNGIIHKAGITMTYPKMKVTCGK